ncbi:type IX secretion system membrane protein, PorP/SprF family [Cyclobacterium lianum]|uniref:Type IX secretion system membrane protein, PorP/SprF family n=1 Tax=Cyclobacterium lianum TaxID=388280 RepID=A0A1M7K9N3_9BACT|nr:type IX secretion system membrane protein PorP/SprF [Cyclobacterium lianum]SHM61976.1 type IX secretion system membrane protein, PorP/SprF family [Cyclobacterium lianum]
MSIKSYLLTCVFFFLVFLSDIPAVIGQQDAQFTQYMYNGLFYNPAFAGKDGGYSIAALHRSQWLDYATSTGAGGAPTTQLLSASGRVKNIPVGFGLVAVNDQIGPFNNQEVNLSLAYHLTLGRGVLSMGAAGGFFSSTIRYDEFIPVNPDPNIPSGGNENQLHPNVSVGLMYDRGSFYLGLSSRNLNEPGFDFGDGSLANRLENHNYLLLGYRINTFAQFSVEPSILVKSVSLNNFSYDLSVIGSYNNKISLGLAYRGEESASVLLGYSLLRDNSLKLGYAFDLVVGGLEAKSPTSHEFMLTYNLPQVARQMERVIQRTPRFRF